MNPSRPADVEISVVTTITKDGSSAGSVTSTSTVKIMSKGKEWKSWADEEDSDDEQVVRKPIVTTSSAPVASDTPVASIAPVASVTTVVTVATAASAASAASAPVAAIAAVDPAIVQEERTAKIVPNIRTLVARNLPRAITTQQLRRIFEKYGTIRDIYIPANMDKSSRHYGTIKGFALIKFDNSNDSLCAFQELYGGLTLSNKPIGLEFAKQDRD